MTIKKAQGESASSSKWWDNLTVSEYGQGLEARQKQWDEKMAAVAMKEKAAFAANDARMAGLKADLEDMFNAHAARMAKISVDPSPASPSATAAAPKV